MLRLSTALLACAALSSGCTAIVNDQLSSKPRSGTTEDSGTGGPSCNTTEQCIALDPFNCGVVCSAENRCVAGTPPDGTICGTADRDLCVGGTCVSRGCGDGFVERTGMPPEYCDDGNTNDVDGCNNACTRSCLPPAPTDCDDEDICNGGEMCHRTMGFCVGPGPNLPDGAECDVDGRAGLCFRGHCVTS